MRLFLRCLYTQDFNPCLGYNNVSFVSTTKAYIVASKCNCQALLEEVIQHFNYNCEGCQLYARDSYSDGRDSNGRSDLLAAMAIAFDSALNGDDDVEKLRDCLLKFGRGTYYEHHGRFCDHFGHSEYHCIRDQLSEEQPDRKPFLDFLAQHAEAAAYCARELGHFGDLEAVTLFECPGCGAIMSDEAAACDGLTTGCGLGLKPTMHFRIKAREKKADTSFDQADGKVAERPTEEWVDLVVKHQRGSGCKRSHGLPRLQMRVLAGNDR